MLKLKVYPPLDKKYIENLILEAQSHSGMPRRIRLYTNPVFVSDEELISIVDEILDINNYMIRVHKESRKNKTWRSCDDF